jgi:hypothetical protein
MSDLLRFQPRQQCSVLADVPPQGLCPCGHPISNLSSSLMSRKVFPTLPINLLNHVVASALQRSNLPFSGRILSKDAHRLGGDCFSRGEHAPSQRHAKVGRKELFLRTIYPSHIDPVSILYQLISRLSPDKEDSSPKAVNHDRILSTTQRFVSYRFENSICKSLNSFVI